MLHVRHYIGLDLAQVSDYTAVVSLRREQEIPDTIRPAAMDLSSLKRLEAHVPVPQASPARYYCNIAERFKSDYLVIASHICKLFQVPTFSGQTLVVDGTGVGRPVVDIIRQLRPACRLLPVTITGSAAQQALGKLHVDEWGYWHVPKKELVGTVQAILGTNRLEIAPKLAHAATLVHELKNFSYKISAATAHISYSAWRERDHDDLVLALALACWAGERARQELWVL